MKYFVLFYLFMALLASWMVPSVSHATGLYVQCRTPNGAVIVVTGNCPAGTTYIGPA